ncbi:MAG: hypothetical protein ABSB32_08940 [Thermodesulfobacteriota bacterium]|jgi:hypothetical protein
MAQKSKIKETKKVRCIVANSWEEEQRLRNEGDWKLLPAIPRKRKQRKGRKKRWLSGRCRYERYGGVFQI